VLSADALVHQYWMWRFRDPALFPDALTAALRRSSRYPDGYEAVFRLAAQVADPIAFGEWVGVALMAVSGWLVFSIVREHTSWRPAAWIAAALFLALMDIHRFHGGFPRAFVHPVVLLCVLLAIRGRHLGAALVAAGGALFYPPAALLAIGALLVSAVAWSGGRPRLHRRRSSAALVALALGAAAVLGPQLIAGGSPRVLTAAEARAYPEFNPRGTLHFFADSTFRYLRQNRSGLDLRTSGTILAAAALALLAARRGNVRRLRPEVLALPVVALGAFAVAHAVLFRLYLPHRYTYPLVAFFAIAAGVALRPAWRGREGAAAVTGLLLVGALLLLPDHGARGSSCRERPATRYVSTLPKDVVIAGDPLDLTCLPATARRPVVISTHLAPAYEVDYFLAGRERMFATLRGYYGDSLEALADLRERYHVTHVWVRRNAVRAELRPGGTRWRAGGNRPYGPFVRRLVAGGGEPAILHLPGACVRWRRASDAVYDVGCIAARWAKSGQSARSSSGNSVTSSRTSGSRAARSSSASSGHSVAFGAAIRASGRGSAGSKSSRTPRKRKVRAYSPAVSSRQRSYWSTRICSAPNSSCSRRSCSA
jgi:hypothetical protein